MSAPRVRSANITRSFEFIMEGDTPAFLGLTNNGLASYRNPSWGGWGGRYLYRQPYGESRAIWTQGGDAFARVTSQDAVFGRDGKLYLSDQATIWRWRTAFQHDFAARMDWTVTEFTAANHAPTVVVNGVAGTAPLHVAAQVGQPLVFDAAGSSDPDGPGQRLNYRWFHYAEAGFVPGEALAKVTLSAGNAPRTTVTVTEACRPAWIPSKQPCPRSTAHIILEVTDSGSPALTSYRRVILDVRSAATALTDLRAGVRTASNRPQKSQDGRLDPLTQLTWIGERGFRLEAAAHIVQAPFDKVLAVVAEQAVALFAEPRARALHDFRARPGNIPRAAPRTPRARWQTSPSTLLRRACGSG